MKCESLKSVSRKFWEEEEQGGERQLSIALCGGCGGDGAGGGRAARSQQVWESLLALMFLALESLWRALIGA